jgi:hypothetical protein
VYNGGIERKETVYAGKLQKQKTLQHGQKTYPPTHLFDGVDMGIVSLCLNR